MTVRQTRGVIIQGSSRSIGHTSLSTKLLNHHLQFDIIDLKTKNIGYFDYTHQNAHDDFIPLMKEAVSTYDIFIFASPVYWYSMSAEMKTFFDRISDLLKTEKETGRSLRGKQMAVLSCSGSDDVPPSFYEPFILSAKYLGMDYIGHCHSVVDSNTVPAYVRKQIETFASSLQHSIN